MRSYYGPRMSVNCVGMKILMNYVYETERLFWGCEFFARGVVTDASFASLAHHILQDCLFLSSYERWYRNIFGISTMVILHPWHVIYFKRRDHLASKYLL